MTGPTEADRQQATECAARIAEDVAAAIELLRAYPDSGVRRSISTLLRKSHAALLDQPWKIPIQDRLNEAERRAAKAETLSRQWNIEASKYFAGSEYVDDPKNVFARVQQLRDSHGESMKAKVKAEAEKAQLQSALRNQSGVIAQLSERIATLEEQLKQAHDALKRIATEHQAYDDPGVPDGNYGIGVVDGHRCAAKIARAAIEAVNKEA